MECDVRKLTSGDEVSWWHGDCLRIATIEYFHFDRVRLIGGTGRSYSMKRSTLQRKLNQQDRKIPFVKD